MVIRRERETDIPEIYDFVKSAFETAQYSGCWPSRFGSEGPTRGFQHLAVAQMLRKYIGHNKGTLTVE